MHLYLPFAQYDLYKLLTVLIHSLSPTVKKQTKNMFLMNVSLQEILVKMQDSPALDG